eukprot:3359861-Pleurochrysis_carterae.AAC.1
MAKLANFANTMLMLLNNSPLDGETDSVFVRIGVMDAMARCEALRWALMTLLSTAVFMEALQVSTYGGREYTCQALIYS